MDSFYTVIRGDSLFGIAQRFYGDGNKFPIIAQANGIADPDRIFPGQVLVIPGIAGPRGHGAAAADTLSRREAGREFV